MDFLNSFFQNIKDKLTSPFFGTLSFILLVHHWEFWYTLFNLDVGLKLPEKLVQLKSLASVEFTANRMFNDVFWAACVMLTGYFIVIATRTLSILIEGRTMPWITGRVMSANVVDRKVHEAVVLERNEYSEKYEEQRQFVRKYSTDYDGQMEQIQQKNVQISGLNEDVSNLNNQVNLLNNDLRGRISELSQLNNDRSDKDGRIAVLEKSILTLESHLEVAKIHLNGYSDLFFSNDVQAFYSAVEKFPPTITKLVQKLKNDHTWNELKKIVQYERNGFAVGTESYRVLENKGIVIPDTRDFTPVGKILLYYFDVFQPD